MGPSRSFHSFSLSWLGHVNRFDPSQPCLNHRIRWGCKSNPNPKTEKAKWHRPTSRWKDFSKVTLYLLVPTSSLSPVNGMFYGPNATSRGSKSSQTVVKAVDGNIRFLVAKPARFCFWSERKWSPFDFSTLQSLQVGISFRFCGSHHHNFGDVILLGTEDSKSSMSTVPLVSIGRCNRP